MNPVLFFSPQRTGCGVIRFTVPRLLLFSMLLLFAGCAGREAGTGYFPIVQQEARVRWEQTTRDRLIADVVFSHDASDGSALMIGKHQTWLELLRRGDTLRASGRAARPAWRGPVQNAPAAFRDWVILLQAWQAARNLPGEGKKELHTPEYRVSFERSGGTMQNMMVRPTGSGSNFLVRFLP